MTIKSITRVSTAAEGTQGNSGSLFPVFSPDGTRVALLSNASNLVPGDTNNAADIFVVELDDAWVLPPPATWLITPQSVRVNEADGTVDFTVSRPDETLAQTVYISTVQNQGPTNDGDYDGKLDEPVVFAAGQRNQTVNVAITDDAVAGEPDEAFGLVVSRRWWKFVGCVISG